VNAVMSRPSGAKRAKIQHLGNSGRGDMRDYWLSKLFFDLQSSPTLADEYKADRKKVLDRYPLKPEARKAVETDDVAYCSRQVNPYLLRFYFFVAGMSEQDFLSKVKAAGAEEVTHG
jgi:hypothetical protein